MIHDAWIRPGLTHRFAAHTNKQPQLALHPPARKAKGQEARRRAFRSAASPLLLPWLPLTFNSSRSRTADHHRRALGQAAAARHGGRGRRGREPADAEWIAPSAGGGASPGCGAERRHVALRGVDQGALDAMRDITPPESMGWRDDAPGAALPDRPTCLPRALCPQLTNVVSTVSLDCKPDLKNIALGARNAEYNPRR